MSVIEQNKESEKYRKRICSQMEKRIQYEGFDSEWVKGRKISPTTMKPGHLIRINKNDELRFVITSRAYCTFSNEVKLPVHTKDGNLKDKLFVPCGNKWVRTADDVFNIAMLPPVVREGSKRAIHYELEKITDRNIRQMLMETKFYLHIIDVILPNFETREQSNIAYEDA